jgi:hypothetical protein
MTRIAEIFLNEKKGFFTLTREQLVDVAKALAYLGPVGRVQVFVGGGQGALILRPCVTVTRLSFNRQVRYKRSQIYPYVQSHHLQ